MSSLHVHLENSVQRAKGRKADKIGAFGQVPQSSHRWKVILLGTADLLPPEQPRLELTQAPCLLYCMWNGSSHRQPQCPHPRTLLKLCLCSQLPCLLFFHAAGPRVGRSYDQQPQNKRKFKKVSWTLEMGFSQNPESH